MISSLLALAIALTALPLGYWFIHRVPDERQHGERILRLVQALTTLSLFAVLPWWQAALIVGGLLLGWFPALIAYGFLAALTADRLGALLVTIVLGVLLGTRWRLDERSPWQLVAWSVVFAVGASAILLI